MSIEDKLMLFIVSGIIIMIFSSGLLMVGLNESERHADFEDNREPCQPHQHWCDNTIENPHNTGAIKILVGIVGLPAGALMVGGGLKINGRNYEDENNE